MYPVKTKPDSYYHDLTLGGPWPEFKLYKMPPQHERIFPLPPTVFRSKLPERVEIDKRGNPIAIYRGWPKWMYKDIEKEKREAEKKNARPDKRGLRSGPGRDVVAKLTAANEGQESSGV